MRGFFQQPPTLTRKCSISTTAPHRHTRRNRFEYAQQCHIEGIISTTASPYYRLCCQTWQGQVKPAQRKNSLTTRPGRRLSSMFGLNLRQPAIQAHMSASREIKARSAPCNTCATLHPPETPARRMRPRSIIQQRFDLGHARDLASGVLKKKSADTCEYRARQKFWTPGTRFGYRDYMTGSDLLAAANASARAI